MMPIVKTVPRERTARIEHILNRAVKAEQDGQSAMVPTLLAMAQRLEDMSPGEYARLIGGLEAADEERRTNRPIGF